MSAVTDILTDTLVHPIAPAAPVTGLTETQRLPQLPRPSLASRTRTMTAEELAPIRARLEPGRYLIFINDSYEPEVYPIRSEWVRIGRSLAADIRLEGTDMSRRHALIVAQPDGLRVVDDRSLNGVHVNGERIDWSALEDGDEITLGHHVLYYASAPGED